MSEDKITIPAGALKQGDTLHITAKGTIRGEQSFPMAGIPWLLDYAEKAATTFPGITRTHRMSPNGLRIYYADGYEYPAVAQPLVDYIDDLIVNGTGEAI